jgi:hypothetical protein
MGLTSFSKENEYMPADLIAAVNGASAAPRRGAPLQVKIAAPAEQSPAASSEETPAFTATTPSQRSVVVVCPSRELSYPLGLIKDLGADTTNADFGQFNTGDILKSASKWVDLSDSETIWRD